MHFTAPDVVGLPSMGPEINTDSILALEKQIEESEGDVIHLKRVRNSLLNISTRVPPEILGNIFRWNVIPEGEFDGLEKGSYNFLLVCHHWFEVASGTPELWTFWGNTLEQWSQRYQRSGTAPLDIVLNEPYHTPHANTIHFDGPLRDALRDRAASDSLRSVRLQNLDPDLLRSVILSLTLDGGGVRYSSIESLILENADLDIPDFLPRYRFPKLRNLRLVTSVRTPSWDHLKLLAPSLTTLLLDYGPNCSSLTTSQLLSILASYPNLRDLSLYGALIPHDIGDGSTFRVPLRHLKGLHLRGGWRRVFRLLDRLEYPDTSDHVRLELTECAAEGISEFLSPYLRDRIRHDDRFRGRLEIRVSSVPNSISFRVNVVGESNTPITPPGRHGHPSVSFALVFKDAVPQYTRETLCISLIALTPRENVAGLTGGLSAHAVRDLAVTMPNIEDLYLMGSVVSDTFLQPDPPSRTKLFPSLRRLSLSYVTLQNDEDWSPLINYLTHQTSGGQAILFRLGRGRAPVPPEVVKEIEDLVEELNLSYPGTW